MSQMTKDLVEYLARLCRIACTEEEKAQLLLDMEKVLEHVRHLDIVPTQGVDECHHVLGVVNVEREDKVADCLEPTALLSNAPDTSDAFICVPPILRKHKS